LRAHLFPSCLWCGPAPESLWLSSTMLVHGPDGRKTDKRSVFSVPKSRPYMTLMVSCGGGDSKMSFHVILGGSVQKTFE